MTFTYTYPKADHTVDAVVFSADVEEGILKLLLIRRGREKEPFFDSWALPGGFISIDETLEQSLIRELREETGLHLSFMEQLRTYGDPKRDPRGRVISTAFLALVSRTEVQGGDDAAEAKWFDVPNLVSYAEPPLAFDHMEIALQGLARLRSRILRAPVAACLMPHKFTLSELQKVYEIVLGTSQDKRNFRRKIMATKMLDATGEQKRGSGRPAKLYTFKEEMEVDGILHVNPYRGRP